MGSVATCAPIGPVPVGIGASHDWEPASRFLQVTAADGLRLQSLNACSTVEVFEEYASTTG